MAFDPGVERRVSAFASTVAPRAGRELDPRARERTAERCRVDAHHPEADRRARRRPLEAHVPGPARAPRDRAGPLDQRAPECRSHRCVGCRQADEAPRAGQVHVERSSCGQDVGSDAREASSKPGRLGRVERRLDGARSRDQPPRDEHGHPRQDRAAREQEGAESPRAGFSGKLDLDLAATLVDARARLAPELLVLRMAPLEDRDGALDLGESNRGLRGRLRRAFACAQVDSLHFAMNAIVRHLTAHAALLGGCAALATLAMPACSASPPLPARATSAAHLSDVVRSNVERTDYAGSAACIPCHADVSAAWERSPMHRMTRDVGGVRGVEVCAPFDGTTWHFKDDAVVLEKRGNDRFVRLAPAAGAGTTYRVTRVIGGRTREDFAGVEVGGHGEEMVLPVSYLIGARTLRYKGYSVMVHERSTVRAGPIWSRTCIFCHNTVPELDGLLGALAGPGAPGYQGEQVDRWLPVERRAPVRVTDPGSFAIAANDEIARLGGVAVRGDDPKTVARHALDVVRAGFDGDALLEVGIGCESCHGGAREHTRNPRVHPSFAPVAAWLEATPPASPALSPGLVLKPASASASAPAPAINRVCARCHQVLFSRYPFTWEGGRRDTMPGGSHINSGEGRDFLLGGCAAAMACTTCHDPHGGAQEEKLR